jgi:acyl-CoA thioesterase-1
MISGKLARLVAVALPVVAIATGCTRAADTPGPAPSATLSASVASANPPGVVAPGASEAGAPNPDRVAPRNADGAAPGTADDRPVILFVGTSLTAGLGLDPSEAYPALVQARLDAAGLRYRVVNAGVSGETSAGALRRVDWLLRQPVAVLVLETGANDGLRGQDPDATRANIQSILDEARRHQPPPRLVLAAMEAPPNYGEAYRRRFRAVYPELAKANAVTLLPFLLGGVAGDPALNQPDGIHPTAAGHARIAETVWKALRPVL